MEQTIEIRYRACDGFSAVKKFKTLAGARRYAQKMVDTAVEFGPYYAVSFDGIGRITVTGIDIKKLF